MGFQNRIGEALNDQADLWPHLLAVGLCLGLGDRLGKKANRGQGNLRHMDDPNDPKNRADSSTPGGTSGPGDQQVGLAGPQSTGLSTEGDSKKPLTTIDKVLSGELPIEQMGLTFVAYLYDKVINMVGESGERSRQESRELSRYRLDLDERRLKAEDRKWFFSRGVELLWGILVFGAIVTGIGLAWRAGDRDLAKSFLTFAGGGAAGWGVKSAWSGRQERRRRRGRED